LPTKNELRPFEKGFLKKQLHASTSKDCLLPEPDQLVQKRKGRHQSPLYAWHQQDFLDDVFNLLDHHDHPLG
jgi:hypothetical protein